MPREVFALVSADDVVAAVRVHADRVHDLLRRSGCGPEESVEVCESYAFALVDALVNAPETVGDMAGWWFGRALELGRRLGGAGDDEADVPASVLSGTEGEGQVRAALAALPEQERAAVMLRDGYDLPPEAVAVALGRSVDDAAEVVAIGRIHLISRYDNRPVGGLAEHTGRTSVDLGTLGRLADGSLPTPRTAQLRRHLGNCSACDSVVEVQAKGRRVAAGLPIVAMPDDAREAMIDRVAVRAANVLPSVDEVLVAIESEGDVGPAISPLVVVVAIALALVLGVAVALVTSSDATGNHVFADATPTTLPEQPSFSLSPTPTRHHRSPSATPSRSQSASPTTAPTSASPSPTRSATTPPAVPATITLSPTSGPNGTTITVSGRGWTPGRLVTLRYRGTLTSSSSTATVDDRGKFSGQIVASGTLPGNYRVEASGGGDQASAPFRQTT